MRAIVALLSVSVALAVAGSSVRAEPSERIAFVRGGRIWVVNRDGSGSRKLTMTPSGIDASELAWSPDGGTILYLKEDRLTCGIPCDDLAAVGSDGHSVPSVYRRLRFPNAYGLYRPSWSPDGTLLASEAYGIHRGDANILVVSPRDGVSYRFVAGGLDAWGYNWSPDSKWICLSGGPEGGLHLYLVRAAAGPPIALGRANDAGCAWSADSRRLAFSDGRDIFAADVMGSRATRLTFDPAREIAPVWSRSGTLAFLRQEARPAHAAYDVWTMRTDGSGQQWLTFNASQLAWSPDGTTLAFIRSGRPPESVEYYGQPEPQGLWVIRPDRSGQRLIAGGRTSEFAWQPVR